MTTDVTHDLPKVVGDHIAACNAHDVEAWMAAFATDALLNDIQREFAGADAIHSFGDREIFGNNVTMQVQQAWDRDGTITVHSKMDGAYDKIELPDPYNASSWQAPRSRWLLVNPRPTSRTA